MQVIGISRTVRPLANFDHMVDHASMLGVLGDVDYLVLTIPYTRATHHIVNAQFLSHMKPSRYLVNIARGGIVDEHALVGVLETGKILGAGLDVFSVEPLPPESALCKLENVILTAHQGGFSDDYVEHAFPVLEENLVAFPAGDLASMVGLCSGKDSLLVQDLISGPR